MRAEEIIAKAELVHSCSIKWSLKSYECNAFVVKEEPIDELALVICDLVDKCCNDNNKASVGIMLGFSLIDDEPNHYYDATEQSLFEDLLKIVEDKHLITVNDNTIALTNLGSISLQEEKLYTFYKTNKALYEHLVLNAPDVDEMKMFPFFEDMGISSLLNITSAIWPSDSDVERIIFDDLPLLSERLNLLSDKPSHIYDPVQSQYFEVKTLSVNVNLFEDQSGYYPIIMNGNMVAAKVTGLLYLPCNELLLENITLECRFKKLWADRSSRLDFNTLEPFFEFVDFDELVKDERIAWEDDKLFHKVAEEGTTDCWITISKKAPIAVLYSHMDEFSDRYDWEQLSDSSRTDDDYLLEHFLNLPWDLEIISNDQYRDIEVIEKLILMQKDSIDVWDWDALKPRLSKKFILDHLKIVDVNLFDFTEDEETIRTLIKAYPEKLWDWNKIESMFSLEYILDNIVAFEKHLSFNELMDRVFSDEDWCNVFASNTDFIDAAKHNVENNGRLASSVYNDKDYVWSDNVIEIFSTLGLIFWETTRYMQGFECNDSLIWNPSFFAKYHDKVISEAGYSHVSKSIIDINLLAEYPSFHWNWDAISSNQRLLSHPELFSKYSDHLNWVNAITTLPSTSIVESIPDIDSVLGENEEIWTAFSQKANTDFVKSHPLFSWDWSILTKRMFSKLKPQNLGHHLFVDKWDWDFLSSELEPEFISENLGKFKNKWNWSTILARITNPAERISESYIEKIADILNSIDDEDVFVQAWKAFTEQYNLSELKTISSNSCRTIETHWDFASICSMDGFNVFDDLEAFGENVDWFAISQSDVVDKQLIFNPRMGIKEAAWKGDVKKLLLTPGSQWDFSALSHFESLNAQEWFLTNYQKKVDWDYVSSVSKVFCATDKQEINRIVEKFKDDIHFDKLSLRVDIDLDQIVKLFPDEDYDYNAMVANNAFTATADFVDKHKNYDWDWKLLSSLETFVPDEHFMFKYASKPFDWKILSNRDLRSVWSSEQTIIRLAHNSDAYENIDWLKVSSNSVFPLSDRLFEELPLEKLAWKSISGRRKIYVLIDNYGSYLDWKAISENSGFKVIDDANIEKYKHYLDWTSLCARDDFKIDNERIEKYADFIDWSAASASQDIIFTVELVEKYKDKWNWPVLVRNCAFNNNVQMREHGYMKEENIISFINHFSQKPKAYHVTHMSNAVNIIKAGKLQSRDKADGIFVNSAGSNVYRRGAAHRYARFYFRPKSPTQFHFECLGKVRGMDYYSNYCSLGQPKCPLPVFFIFDVEEALQKFPDKCWYSTGNMQSDSARIYKVVNDPNHINGQDIYTRPNKENMNARQQEFLVDEEVDLTVLDSLRICCYDNFQTNMLIREVEGSILASKIEQPYYDSLFERINKELILDEEEDSIFVNTNYTDQYEFRIEYNNQVPTIEDTYSSPREKNHNIYLDGSFEIKKDVEFKIYFEVNTPSHRSWLIYSNK